MKKYILIGATILILISLIFYNYLSIKAYLVVKKYDDESTKEIIKYVYRSIGNKYPVSIGSLLAYISYSSIKDNNNIPLKINDSQRKGEYKMYVWVNDLRIHNAPGLKEKVIGHLDENDEVFYLEETSYKEKYELRGKIYLSPWIKIKDKKGVVGWVFGAALKRYEE